ENEVDVRRVGEAWFPVEMLFTLEDGSRITAKPLVGKDGLSAPIDYNAKPPWKINDGFPAHGVIEYKLENSKDGKQWTDSWVIDERWKKFKFTTGSKLVTAEVDPERKVLLDANLTNNGKTNSKGVGGAVRWSSGTMYWVQAILQAFSFLS